MATLKKNKKAKTKYDIAYICMLIVAGLIIVGTGTYAYYRSTISGTTSGTIAKWSFKANNQASTINIDWGGMYPGKSDTKYIELSAEGSDLPVIFSVVVNLPNVMNADGTAKEYASLLELLTLDGNIYFDNNYAHGLRTDSTVGFFGILLEGEKVTLPIYYNWPYERNSDDDSEVEDSLGGQTLSTGLTIIGQQMDISNSESFDANLLSFLENINYNCTMGEYDYSNKFGYPCDSILLIPNEDAQDMLSAGQMVDYELKDGTVVEFYKYFTTGLIAVGAE